MKKIKYSLNVLVKEVKNYGSDSTESGKVVIRTRWNSKKCEVGFFVGHYVEPVKFDSASKRCVRNTFHIHNGKKVSASEINASIQDLENAIVDAFTSFELSEILPTTKELKEKVYSILGHDGEEVTKRFVRAHEAITEPTTKQLGLFQAYDKFIQSNVLWSKNHTKKHGETYNHLQSFGKRLKFSDLDSEVMRSFMTYLIKCGMCNETIQGHFKRLRCFFRWCEKQGFNFDKSVIEYRTGLKEVGNKEVVFLTWEEFNKLYNYEIPTEHQHLQKVKDTFLFQCVTGLRYSDMSTLKRSMIQDDRFTIITQKTGERISIFLNRYSKEILDKYKDIHFRNDCALPSISNQKMNQYLKELCKLAEIDTPVVKANMSGTERHCKTAPKYEFISSHSGRKTYVSLALFLGASTDEVRKVSGHHSLKVMERYIGLNEAQRKHATSVFDARSEREQLMSKLENLSTEDLKELLTNLK